MPEIFQIRHDKHTLVGPLPIAVDFEAHAVQHFNHAPDASAVELFAQLALVHHCVAMQLADPFGDVVGVCSVELRQRLDLSVRRHHFSSLLL